MPEPHRKVPSRSQLVGMTAQLRGIIVSLLQGHPLDVESDREDAAEIMKQTVFYVADEDLVDGGFDTSWIPE